MWVAPVPVRRAVGGGLRASVALAYYVTRADNPVVVT